MFKLFKKVIPMTPSEKILWHLNNDPRVGLAVGAAGVTLATADMILAHKARKEQYSINVQITEALDGIIGVVQKMSDENNTPAPEDTTDVEETREKQMNN